jgi:hypothetical protein
MVVQSSAGPETWLIMPYSYRKLDDDDSGLDETGFESQAAPFLEDGKSSRDERPEESNHNWQSIAWYKRPSVRPLSTLKASTAPNLFPR